MSDQLLIALIAGGFALLGAAAGSVLGFLSTNYTRKATVRDSAFAHDVEACAEFAGASHTFITRQYEYIQVLAKLKEKTPEGAVPGQLIDQGEMKARLSPLHDRVYSTVVRAETFAPTKQVFESVHEMSVAQSLVIEILNQAQTGELPDDWKRQLEAWTTKHDEASQRLTENLREIGATTSYRKSFPGRSSKPTTVDDQ